MNTFYNADDKYEEANHIDEPAFLYERAKLNLLRHQPGGQERNVDN